jgi:hypothetical protein
MEIVLNNNNSLKSTSLKSTSLKSWENTTHKHKIIDRMCINKNDFNNNSSPYLQLNDSYISGKTLLLLDTVIFGEEYVSNNVKWNRLIISTNNNNFNINNTCIYHNYNINKEIEDIFSKIVSRDVAKLIIKFTQHRNCNICSCSNSNNLFYYNSHPTSIISFYSGQNTQHLYYNYNLIFNDEISIPLEPNKTFYNFELPFSNRHTYLLCWAVINSNGDILNIEDDLIEHSIVRFNGRDRFNYNSYESLVFDKRVNGLNIPNNKAVHTYTFADLHTNIEDSVRSTLNCGRFDNINFRITTKNISNLDYCIHISTIGVEQI